MNQSPDVIGTSGEPAPYWSARARVAPTAGTYRDPTVQAVDRALLLVEHGKCVVERVALISSNVWPTIRPRHAEDRGRVVEPRVVQRGRRPHRRHPRRSRRGCRSGQRTSPGRSVPYTNRWAIDTIRRPGILASSHRCPVQPKRWAILRGMSARIEHVEFAGSQGGRRWRPGSTFQRGRQRVRSVRTLLHVQQGSACHDVYRDPADGSRLRRPALRLHGPRRQRGRVCEHQLQFQCRGSGRRRRAWLRDQHAAPQLPIGHSLGGAAVLAAASLTLPRCVRSRPSVRRPPHRTSRECSPSRCDKITRRGAATVELAGQCRSRCASSSSTMSAPRRCWNEPRAFDGALLVLHSPVDNDVGIKKAARIYEAARHPKSFVALDGADRLLTDARDAQFAARIIGTSASRYVERQAGAAPPPPRHLTGRRRRDDPGILSQPRGRRPPPVPRRRAGGSRWVRRRAL